MLLLSFRRFSLAEIICKKDLEKFPNNSLGLNLLAITYRKQGKFLEAAQEFLKLLNKSPNEPSNYRDAIYTLFKAEDYDTVIKYCKEFLNKNFTGSRHHLKPYFFDEIYWYLAFSYYYLNDYQKAKNNFEKIKHIRKWKREYNISQYIKDCNTRTGRKPGDLLPRTRWNPRL